MKERFIENGIEYVKSGDYYIPNLKAEDGNIIPSIPILGGNG